MWDSLSRRPPPSSQAQRSFFPGSPIEEFLPQSTVPKTVCFQVAVSSSASFRESDLIQALKGQVWDHAGVSGTECVRGWSWQEKKKTDWGLQGRGESPCIFMVLTLLGLGELEHHTGCSYGTPKGWAWVLILPWWLTNNPHFLSRPQLSHFTNQDT